MMSQLGVTSMKSGKSNTRKAESRIAICSTRKNPKLMVRLSMISDCESAVSDSVLKIPYGKSINSLICLK